MDDLYAFLGDSPRTCWHKSALELRDDTRTQYEAMPHKHDTLTEARTKLFRCRMEQVFASEQSKADYDAYLRYLAMMRVLEDAGEACAYTKKMESAKQAPHFVRMLRDASGTAGTIVDAATAAGYLLWRAADSASSPAMRITRPPDYWKQPNTSPPATITPRTRICPH